MLPCRQGILSDSNLEHKRLLDAALLPHRQINSAAAATGGGSKKNTGGADHKVKLEGKPSAKRDGGTAASASSGGDTSDAKVATDAAARSKRRAESQIAVTCDLTDDDGKIVWREKEKKKAKPSSAAGAAESVDD